MRPAEFRAHLDALALTPVDAARLLGVGLRTLRRWTQPERTEYQASAGSAGGDGSDAAAGGPDEIPGPPSQALRAWLKLHRLGAHWRPDGLPLTYLDPAAAVARVRERGGFQAASLWDVDLRRGCASMGRHRVSFVWTGRAVGGARDAPVGVASSVAPTGIGWRLQSYFPAPSRVGVAGGRARLNRLADAALAELIDDACASIARRLAGERAPPLPVLVLGESMMGGDTVELRDESWSPGVVCRLDVSALAAFLELPLGASSGITPAQLHAQLLAFARHHRATLCELAAELYARPAREAVSPGPRLLDIGAGDLGLLRGRITWPPPGAAADQAPGAAPGVARELPAVAIADAGEGGV